METASRGSLARAIRDEIGLEGLEGITLPSLWIYLAAALKFGAPLSPQIQQQIWGYIKRTQGNFQFYELPVEREPVELYNRFTDVDELGVPIIADVCPFPRYKFVPIGDGKIIGSCEYYKERKPITYDQLSELSIEDVLNTWGNKFVIVASQELRYDALTPPNVPIPQDLIPIHYSLWEAIGRARYNGETTAGPWSIHQFCKDSSIIFYLKNKLDRYGVISQQPYNEKRQDRFFMSTLITLPRFRTTISSMLTTVIEKLFQLLKEAPNNRMTMAEVRAQFPTIDTLKSFKRISITHIFRRLFETRMLPGSEFGISPSKNSPKERLVQAVCLRDPKLSSHELYFESNEKNDENCESFQNEKHSFVDMPAKDEFYRAVARHGTRGASQREICDYMSLHFFTVRQMIRKGLNEGIIKSYWLDAGRQKVNMYVANEHAAIIKEKKDVSIAVIKALQCADEPCFPPDNDVPIPDVPEINARIKVAVFKVANTSTITTPRQLERKAFVIKSINERCIVQLGELRSCISRTEKEQGLKEEVCQKSIKRLLKNMLTANIVNVYEVILQHQECIRIYRLVTHPKIDIAHKVLEREVLKLKNAFHMTIEERRLRSAKEATEKQRLLAKANKKLAKASDKKEQQEKCATLPTKNQSPKFVIARFMHEFLFYIVVELNEYQHPCKMTEELLLEWQQNEPNLPLREFLQQLEQNEEGSIMAYSRELNWRTFIPPLPKYPDKPAGWVYFMDAIERLPLSIFNKLFHLEKEANPALMSYISHPVRQHYLISQLPPDLRSCNISRIHLQKVYLTVLKLLNHMGLIQVTDRKSPKDPLIMWVFLNRRTHIRDTTSSEASYAKVNPDRKYEEQMFEFTCAEEVHQYWSNLQRICVYTKLGFRTGQRDKPEQIRELKFVRCIDYDEAPQYDNGEVPGDRLGAAGLSKKLFAHNFRSWSWVLHGASSVGTATKAKSNRTRRVVAVGGKQSRLLGVRRNRTHVAVLKRLHPSGNAVAGGSGVVVQGSAKKAAASRDAIDRDALKNMRTLRVSWSKEEDTMLKISRTVYLYIAAPVPVLALLTVSRITRDIIRHAIGSCNKTTQACLRRIQFIVKKNRHVPEVPTWLHMLQTNEELQRKYGDSFLSRLKRAYPNRNEYCDAVALHFALIYCFLYKLLYRLEGGSGASLTTKFMIPDRIEDFHNSFRECHTVGEEPAVQHFNPSSDFELAVSVAWSVLHSSLCCTRDKTLYNTQAFEIYKTFSEDVLKAAFAKAHNDGLAVSVKRKNMQLIPTQLAGPAYLLSSKYRLRLMFLKIPYVIYDAFYKNFEIVLGVFFGRNSNTISTKKTLDLKSPNSGQLLVMAECLSQDFLQLEVKLPKNTLTVDAAQRQTLSPTDRILDHFHSIFDNAPETEYTKAVEAETSGKQVRVKFHPANLSYKIHYAPYDFISKLPARYLHFFCALDHLQQDVDINFSKLHRIDDDNGVVVVECPFNCIMKNANYINAIERIVQEKKTMMNELTEMPPQKLLNLAMSGCSVTVQPSNLLTLVRMLESFWYEKEQLHERKDLGKVSPNIKVNKSIDWHHLCNEIIQFDANDEDNDNNDEYEPTLNKEERIARAQDVFVVNLPTLTVSVSPKMQAEEELMLHNGIEVPKCMLESEKLRDVILEKIVKEAYWSYTENTFATLKPKLKFLDFNAMQQQHLEDLHNFIESSKLGVTIAQLMHEFPYEQFLLRALHVLSEHYLIKRVGVATKMYVHKSQIRPWLVHTFHIKRLERESGAKPMLKRKHANDNETLEDAGPSTSKQIKLENNPEEAKTKDNLGKRVPKPVKRYETETEESKPKTNIEKDVIVMKPQPWMRLNGSLNRRVLDRWLGSILTECIARIGCGVHELFTRFHNMVPVDIMFLLEILCDLKCVQLKQIEAPQADLFAEYEDSKEVIVTELYNPEQTYVVVHADAIMRLSTFIGHKKYNAEFI